MDLQQLRCFVALAEVLNFRKASEKAFVSQPSLSRYISQLEAEHNVTLFERGKLSASVKLTEAGEFLLPKARLLLSEAQLISDQLAQLGDSGGRRAISVGLDSRLAHEQLPSYLHSYSRQTNVTLLMQDLLGQEIPELIRRGTLDVGLAIHLKPDDMSGLICKQICALRLILVVHEDLLKQWGTRDPCELLRHVRPSALCREEEINAHILSVLRAMGCPLPVDYYESFAKQALAIRMCKNAGILTAGFRAIEPHVRHLPIPAEYGAVPVYALMCRESDASVRLVDFIEHSFLQEEFCHP